MLGLEVEGVDAIAELFGQVHHELKDGLRDRLRQADRMLRDEAASRTDSRRMKSGLAQQEKVESLIEFSGRVYVRGKWGFLSTFLERGTKPHPIPNFHGHEGEVFMHPGTSAQPFLAPALEAREDQVVELVGIPPVLR